MYSSEQTERIHLVKALDPVLFGCNTLLMLVASQLRKQILQRATLAKAVVLLNSALELTIHGLCRQDEHTLHTGTQVAS